jgi:hypothetical protein
MVMQESLYRNTRSYTVPGVPGVPEVPRFTNPNLARSEPPELMIYFIYKDLAALPAVPMRQRSSLLSER